MLLISLIFKIACICAGILLAITALDRLDGDSDFFNNIAAKLRPFNTLIGLATLSIGILYIFKFKCIIFALVGIACGILLLPQQLAKIPGIGDNLVDLSKKMQGFKVIIGDAAIILAILSFLGMNPLC